VKSFFPQITQISQIKSRMDEDEICDLLGEEANLPPEKICVNLRNLRIE